MKLTKEEAEARYPGVVFEGDIFWIAEGVSIAEWVRIAKEVSIAKGVSIAEWVSIAEGVSIAAITDSKYIGTLEILKTHTEIIIGCERHTIEEWERNALAIAERHRSKDGTWWEDTGQHMLAFLISQAKLHDQMVMKT